MLRQTQRRAVPSILLARRRGVLAFVTHKGIAPQVGAFAMRLLESVPILSPGLQRSLHVNAPCWSLVGRNHGFACLQLTARAAFSMGIVLTRTKQIQTARRRALFALRATAPAIATFKANVRQVGTQYMRPRACGRVCASPRFFFCTSGRIAVLMMRLVCVRDPPTCSQLRGQSPRRKLLAYRRRAAMPTTAD